MVANTVASRKQKGRLLQQQTRDAIMATFSELTMGDVESTSMGASGVDLKLSPFARTVFPFSVECKAQEALNLWKAWEQAQTNVMKNTNPLLVIKKSRKPALAVLELTTFLSLLRRK